MKYEKPEVATLGSALTSVQGQKQLHTPMENKQTPNIFNTINAYEADE